MTGRRVCVCVCVCGDWCCYYIVFCVFVVDHCDWYACVCVCVW